MARIKRPYGWIRDLPDRRDTDYAYRASAKRIVELPAAATHRPAMPEVYNQFRLGSCVANAGAMAVAFCYSMQGILDFNPARLFSYWCMRKIMGTIEQDSGARIRDFAKALLRWGIPEENAWPYEITKFRDRPSSRAFRDAAQHQAIRYHKVDQDIGQIKARIYAGYPVLFGISVYESFESERTSRTGRIEIPDPEERVVGGHALLLGRYDDDEQRAGGPNSYGPEWGDDGWFSIPYRYLEDPGLAADFWTIELME